MRALELREVGHAFGRLTALDGFVLDVVAGEVVALVGLNGAGKTTALRVLSGRLRPDAGIARVLGHDPAALPTDESRRVGHVIGTPLVYRELTVHENLMASARLHGLDRARAAEATRTAVERFELGNWSRRAAGGLSSGNWQRLGLACATLHGPSALIMDEPTSALDPAGVVIVRELVRCLAEAGAGVLVSSHHLDEVSRVADRILVAHAGRIVGSLHPLSTNLERQFFAMLLAADSSLRRSV